MRVALEGSCCALTAMAALLIVGPAVAQFGGRDGEYGGRLGADPARMDEGMGGYGGGEFGMAGPAQAEALDRPASQRMRAVAAERINAILDQPLRQPLQFSETPLNQVTAVLAEEYELPIVFDRPALDALAVSPEVEVSVAVSGVSLRSALELLLAEVEDLAYVVDKEVLLVTTVDEADQRLFTRVYPVADLVAGASSGRSHGPAKPNFTEFVHVVTATVMIDSWARNGTGEGQIEPLAPGMLVITQTARVHDLVEDLLAQIRLARGRLLDVGQVEDENPFSMSTRGFKLSSPDLVAVEGARSTIADALRRSVPWDNVSAGSDESFLHVVGDRVFVRHTAAVIGQVEQALDQLGLVDGPAAERSAGRGRRGGGF